MNKDSLLHVFAFKNEIQCVYIGNKKKSLKFTHFLKSLLGLGLQVRCEKLQLLQCYKEILKDIDLN